MKKFIAGVLVLSTLMATAMAWAQSPALDRIKKNGVIRVGVKTDYKPFGYLDPSGRVVGLEVDLADDVARRLNVKLELLPVQTANRMEFLQQGRIDLMIATMPVNEQRRKVVGVIEPFYYAGGTSLLARKSSGIKRWEDMLFDEVTAALDPETVKEVLNTIRELVDEGMTSILVTHEMRFAREVAHHVHFTDRGVIVEHGDPAAFFDNPQDPRTHEFSSHVLQRRRRV